MTWFRVCGEDGQMWELSRRPSTPPSPQPPDLHTSFMLTPLEPVGHTPRRNACACRALPHRVRVLPGSSPLPPSPHPPSGRERRVLTPNSS